MYRFCVYGIGIEIGRERKKELILDWMTPRRSGYGIPGTKRNVFITIKFIPLLCV